MAVLPVKTEGRCKLCQSPRRADMDALLEMRSLGLEDDAGARVNLDYVIERYAEWHDGAKLTKDNCTGHFKRHCQLVEPDVVDSLEAAERHLDNAALAIIERVLGPDRHEKTPTVDEMLELQRALYLVELEAKALAGAPLGLTHDHAFKAADTSTKRKQEEATSIVLRQLGAGIGQALLGAAVKPKELPEGDIIEGEIVGE